jgi:hypothetical protein
MDGVHFHVHVVLGLSFTLHCWLQKNAVAPLLTSHTSHIHVSLCSMIWNCKGLNWRDRSRWRHINVRMWDGMSTPTLTLKDFYLNARTIRRWSHVQETINILDNQSLCTCSLSTATMCVYREDNCVQMADSKRMVLLKLTKAHTLRWMWLLVNDCRVVTSISCSSNNTKYSHICTRP